MTTVSDSESGYMQFPSFFLKLVSLMALVPGHPQLPPSTQPHQLDGEWAKMRSIVPRCYLCRKVDHDFDIDGTGRDPQWNAAPWTHDFVDIEGDRRPIPRFQTRAKMIWTDTHLYVLAYMLEPHVWGTITKKNEVIFRDNDFEIFLDPDGDNFNYYEFEMNALNTIWELNLVKPYRNHGPIKSPWNIEGLQTKVHVDGTLNQPGDIDRGWSVEIALPWKSLAQFAGNTACPPLDQDRWRINFSRVEWLVEVIDGTYRKVPKERHDEDNWVWSPQGVIDMHRPERWGFLQFTTQENQTSATPSPDLPQRDELMQLYYRQDEFKKLNGHYADTIQELGIHSRIELTVSADGYQATLDAPESSGGPAKLHVNQDSHLWK